MNFLSIIETARLPLCAFGFGVGGIFLKRYADTGAGLDLGVSLAVYLASNLVFVGVLRAGLGAGMVTSSMAQLVLMSLAGIAFFGERLSPPQLAGLACALAAIALFSLPAPCGDGSS